MIRALVIRSLCILALAIAPTLAEGAAAKKTATPRKAKTTTTARASKAKKASTTPVASTAQTRTAGSRRLEDIHIEGEVPVPQVLFITARDQRRFLESHHDMYLRTCRELGASTPLPARVVLTSAAPAPATAPATAPAKSGDGR